MSTNHRTLEKLTTRLLVEEGRNKAKENDSEVAFQTIERTRKPNIKVKQKLKEERKCYKCGNVGHIARNCSREGTSRETNPGGRNYKECSICKKTNHLEQNYFYRKKTNHDRNKIAFLTKNGNSSNQYFVVDSGSSSHMANSRDMFINLTETQSSINVAKKNEKMTAKEKGTI